MRALMYQWAAGDACALRRARAALRTVADRHGLSAETSDDLLLAASELLTNAVEHANGPYQLRVHLSSNDLLCQVVDEDRQVPLLRTLRGAASGRPAGRGILRSPFGLPERGRGLAIVDHVSQGCWGVENQGRKKAVWFRLLTVDDHSCP